MKNYKGMFAFLLLFLAITFYAIYLTIYVLDLPQEQVETQTIEQNHYVILHRGDGEQMIVLDDQATILYCDDGTVEITLNNCTSIKTSTTNVIEVRGYLG